MGAPKLENLALPTKTGLSIEDTGMHPDLPPELIQRYGIISYFGFPVVVNGTTVGIGASGPSHSADQSHFFLVAETC